MRWWVRWRLRPGGGMSVGCCEAGTDAAVAAIDAAGDAARERVLRAGGEYVGLVGGGAVGVVPRLLPVSAQLPVEVAAADEDVRVALGALGVEDTAANRERVLDARGVFLDVVAAHLRHMSAVPRELRTPSWRQLYVDMLAAFVANVVGFAVPTALGQLGRSRQAQTWIYSGAVAALGVVGPQMSSLVKRWWGGANAQWRLSLGDSANVGPYKLILGELGLALGNLALYAATHAGMSATGGVWSTPGGQIGGATGGVWSTPGGQIGRALVSGAVMSVAGQGITNAAAGWTLSRSGVVRADRLAETARNRTIPDGVYHDRCHGLARAHHCGEQGVGVGRADGRHGHRRGRDGCGHGAGR